MAGNWTARATSCDAGGMGPKVPLALRSLHEALRLAGQRDFDGDIVIRERDGASHRITLRGGVIVAARVAGRFNPLLESMRRTGALAPEGFVRALEALARSERRSGQLAIERGGASARSVREALAAQLSARLTEIHRRALENGRETWLEARSVAATEAAGRVEATRAPRATAPPRATRPASAPSVPPAAPLSLEQRRALRRLAFMLHPDRHAHLPEPERNALERRLADATARFHAR